MNPNYNLIAGTHDSADNLAVGQTPGFINVTKGCLDIWANDVAMQCKNPVIASVTDSRIFKQLRNTGELRLDWIEMTGMGDWGVKAEKQNVLKGAVTLADQRSFCTVDFYKDMPVTHLMRRMRNSDSIISMALQKFIQAARRTDEKAGFSLISNATYTVAEGNLVELTPAGATPTPAEYEALVEAGANALMNQVDADGNLVECFEPTQLLVAQRGDAYIALSKALKMRTDGCCDVNGMQYAGIAGLTIRVVPYFAPGEMYLVNSTSTLYRDIVSPLTVVYRDHMYSDNWESYYRGFFSHRYFQADKLGLVKLAFN